MHKETVKSDFVFGMHPVMEALKSDKQTEKILVQNNLKSENCSLLPRKKTYPYKEFRRKN
jgi:tRNA G18 (ribose-2'-O)-methylase SpoU